MSQLDIAHIRDDTIPSISNKNIKIKQGTANKTDVMDLLTLAIEMGLIKVGG